MTLVCALAKGEIDKVTILLAMGARVDVREQGFTPLGTLSKKKNDIIWEFFPNVGPPTPPPFGNPLSKSDNFEYP